MSELLDEKFKNVRKTPGIQIWRIEQLEMKEVPENDYGIFYGGDSYILMKTIEKRCELFFFLIRIIIEHILSRHRASHSLLAW